MDDKLFDLGPIQVWDFQDALSPGWIAENIIQQDDCGLKEIQFAPGDIVLDIGANIGIFSLYLAKLHPEVTIIGIEPSLKNYEHFVKNIQQNGATNVEAVNLAFTKDRRMVRIGVYEGNTGGADIYNPAHGCNNINDCPSVRLDDFLADRGLTKIKAMKIDVQGSEYEVFDGFQSWDKIEYLCGDLHPVPSGLYGNDYSKEKLIELIESKFPADRRFLRIE